MKNNCFWLVLAMLVVFGAGCTSRMNVRERVEIPVLLNGQVYTNSFERTDRSKIAPGGPRVIHHGGGGSFFRFRAEMGGAGSAPYYGSGYPMIQVPLESQGAFQQQTAERYGLGGGGRSLPAGTVIGNRYSY